MSQAYLLQIFSVVYIFLFALCAVYDFVTLTIPNYLVVSIALLFFATALSRDGDVRMWSHVAPATVVLGVGAALFYFGQIGGGDAKLATVAVLWAGSDFVGPYLLVMGVAGLVATLVILSVRPGLRYLSRRAPIFMEGTRFFPRALVSGAPIPYGVPIAIASIWLSTRLALFH